MQKRLTAKHACITVVVISSHVLCAGDKSPIMQLNTCVMQIIKLSFSDIFLYITGSINFIMAEGPTFQITECDYYRYMSLG